MKERYNSLLEKFPHGQTRGLLSQSRTVYKSTVIRVDGEEKGATCRSDSFAERCCFGSTTKQRFISAKISYDIFFTDDIRLFRSTIPVTLFTKDEIESFVNYLRNVVDFEFSIEYGKVTDFDLFENDDDFASYLRKHCTDEVSYRDLTGFLLHVTIDAIRPIHAFILQWIRQIYDGRAQFYTDVTYELKKLPEFKKMSLFTIMSLVYNSLRYSEGSTDMCVFPDFMYEGRLPFQKMRDRFNDMNRVFKRFANIDIYSTLRSSHTKEVPKSLEELADGDYLCFIDTFWNDFGRDLFIENQEIGVSNDKKIAIFSASTEMSGFVNDYDNIINSFAEVASLIVSKKWKLDREGANWRDETKKLIDNIYSYVNE